MEVGIKPVFRAMHFTYIRNSDSAAMVFAKTNDSRRKPSWKNHTARVVILV
jgi:hypothetical protein